MKAFKQAMSIAFHAAALGSLLATCASPGERCESDSDCGGGSLFCAKPIVDGTPARYGVCAPHPAGPNGFCRATADCDSMLLCSNELPSPTKQRDGRCIPLRQTGEPCANSESCEPPLTCELSETNSGICVQPPPPDAGSPDDTGSDR